ncbi:MAG: dihydroorotate dehydrogenase-like protein [Spirochaetaceae bacterium]|nr:MAG: dihydroorotate dehydrogenase-like protein [Spirochaetaceae bacterium]
MTPNIRTSYMGFDLVSPVIASSSGITDSVDNLKQLEQCGAGAVVLKSLFEEEIIAEMQRTETQMQRPGFTFPDMADMFDYVDADNGVANYLDLIGRAKQAVALPVIASVNCISAQKWTYFAREIEQQGADGLELNVFLMPSDFDAADALSFQRSYFEIIQMVLEQVSIPVSVKLSHYFTLLGKTLQEISQCGIRGLVLFNRFFSPDFDLQQVGIVPSNVFSSPAELALSLRWIAIMSGRVGCDLAASTGVHDGDGVIKQILAGANAVQVASVLYQQGIETVQQMNQRLSGWMAEQGYSSLVDFRGVLSQARVKNPAAYDRVQFVKNFRAMQ